MQLICLECFRRRCRQRGGRLLHVNSEAELASIKEVVMQMSEFIEVDSEILTGVYHDPYASYSTLDSGEKM